MAQLGLSLALTLCELSSLLFHHSLFIHLIVPCGDTLDKALHELNHFSDLRTAESRADTWNF